VVTRRGQRGRAHHNPIDVEVGVELELDPRVVLQHLETDGVFAGDRPLPRIDPHVEVVIHEIVVRAIAAVVAAQNVGSGRGALG
jgi:hypothetical protein